MKKRLPLVTFVFVATFFLLPTVFAQSVAQTPQSATAPPRVLIVVAHPDDESCFSVTVYEITHNLGGTVDQLVVTNGEGGYRYSLLAEPYYNLQLTNEAVGRAALAEIRKRELLSAGKILGISNHFFLDEKDVRYTQDVDEVLNQHWHAQAVMQQLTRRLTDGNYDFVLTLFPTAETHGAHKAATLSAINAVRDLKGNKPVVLGCQDDPVAGTGVTASPSASPTPTPIPNAAPAKGQFQLDWSGFKSEQHPFTVGPHGYSVDRTVKFGFKNVLDYQIIANWVIAEHKSQGAFQMDMGRAGKEEFAILETDTPSAGAKADQLFNRLSETAAHPLATAASAH